MDFGSWRHDSGKLLQLSEAGAIVPGSELKACGCGVKLDLGEVVYPVLREFGTKYGYGVRQDAACVRGPVGAHRRLLLSLKNGAVGPLAEQFFDETFFVPVATLESRFYEDPELARAAFRQLTRSVFSLIHEVERKGKTSTLTKGHTIEAGGDFVMLDVFERKPFDGRLTYINNDTLITADSLLRTDSEISVFTALNNSLNDLFACGAVEEIELYPVLDGTPEEVEQMKGHLETFRDYYARLGVEIRLVSTARLGQGLSLIGATVLGRSSHRSTPFSGLNAGDRLLVTRKLGDLSVLALHRSLVTEGKPVPNRVSALRNEVLNRFMTSQYEIGRIIREFLPELNEPFDPARHVSFVTDLSGPGIALLEEAAVESQVDLLVEDLVFHDETLLGHYRRNHTSSTNGPMLISGAQSVVERFEKELQGIGIREAWWLGRVLETSANPTIWFSADLKRLQNEAVPRLDFYSPEVHFSNGKQRIPIIRNMKFRD